MSMPKLTLQNVIDALEYASEGRKWSGPKPDLLGNQLNRIIVRKMQQSSDAAALHKEGLPTTKPWDVDAVRELVAATRPAGCICSEAYGVGPEQCGKHKAALHKEASRCNCDITDGAHCPVHRDEYTKVPGQAETHSEERKASQSDENADSSLVPALHKEGAGGAPIQALEQHAIVWELRPATGELIGDEIRLERRDGFKGRRWAVTQRGYVLNKSGEWEWEPNPSSRTEEWLETVRWESIEAALAASPAGRAEQADAPKETR